MLNDGSFTRLGSTGQRSTAIDLTLVTPGLALDATWSAGRDLLQSDHLPLHILLGDVEPAPAETDNSPGYHYYANAD